MVVTGMEIKVVVEVSKIHSATTPNLAGDTPTICLSLIDISVRTLRIHSVNSTNSNGNSSNNLRVANGNHPLRHRLNYATKALHHELTHATPYQSIRLLTPGTKATRVM